MPQSVERLKQIIAGEAYSHSSNLSRSAFGEFVHGYFKTNPWPDSFINAAYVQYLLLDKSKSPARAGNILAGIRLAELRQ